MSLRTRTELFLLEHVPAANRDAAREELHAMLNEAEMAGRRAEAEGAPTQRAGQVPR